MDGQDLATIEEETTDEPLAPAAEDAPEADEAAGEEPARGDWRAVLARARGEAADEDDDEDDAETGEEEDPETPEKEEPEEREDPEAKKDEAEQPEKKDEDPPAEKPYRVLDAEGKPAELPAGLKIGFKADGKEVDADLDQLIGYAQKGVHADRKFGELGNELNTVRRSAQAQRQQFEQQAAAIEQLLQKVAEGDDETLEKIQETYAKLADPEVREAMEAKAREDARRREEDERQQTERQQALGSVWEAAREKFAEKIGDYELLAEEDADEAMKGLYDGYLAHRTELLGRYEEMAERRGQDVEFARELAEQDALAYLSTENLYAEMQALNERYEKRVGPKAKAAKAEALQATAQAHNQRVEEKKAQGNIRTLRGGPGTDPAAGRAAAAPTTFEGHKERMRRIIRTGLGADADE